MNEHKLLNAGFYSRDIFNLLQVDDLSDQGKILYNLYKGFYDNDDSSLACDKDIIYSKINRLYPKHAEILCRVVESYSSTISIVNIQEELLELRKHRLELSLANALLGNRGNVSDLLEEYNNLSIGITDKYIIKQRDIQDTLNGLDQDSLIPIYPKSLNNVLEGGVPRGTQVLIFARPEVGKTTFVLNLAAVSIYKGLTILYAGFEDGSRTYHMRVMSRLIGKDKSFILSNKEAAISLAETNGLERFLFVDHSDIADLDDLVNFITNNKFDILIVDQARQLNVTGKTSETERLPEISRTLRRLAQKHNFVSVLVHQAGNEANNKLILDQGDAFMSKTAFPGDTDLMIGIGANEEYLNQGRRMLTLCRNKINGNHAQIPITIIPELVKIQ